VVYIVSHKDSDANPEGIPAVTKMAKVLELGARQNFRVDQKQAEALDGRGKVFVDFLKVKELALAGKYAKWERGYVHGWAAVTLSAQRPLSNSQADAVRTRHRGMG
jgi:hypothetical protein